MSSDNLGSKQLFFLQKCLLRDARYNLRDLLNDNNKQVDNKRYFSETEATTAPSIKGKRRIKFLFFSKTSQLYNWNQLESNKLTVLPHE